MTLFVVAPDRVMAVRGLLVDYGVKLDRADVVLSRLADCERLYGLRIDPFRDRVVTIWPEGYPLTEWSRIMDVLRERGWTDE